MGNVVSLSTPGLDWEVLARVVERSGVPIWLELDGTIQGVLLPSNDARRLMGQYVQPVAINIDQVATSDDGAS